MNHAGDDIREVPEPGLIASHVLVGLSRGTKWGLCVGIGGHSITDTTMRDQLGIRSAISQDGAVSVLRLRDDYGRPRR